MYRISHSGTCAVYERDHTPVESKMAREHAHAQREFHSFIRAVMIFLQDQESIYENDVSEIKNKFFQLAKACGMESKFSSRLNLEQPISCLVSPDKDSTFTDSLMMQDSKHDYDDEIRKKLNYADKILAELAADCTAVSATFINSLNEDDVSEESIPSDDVTFSSQYTSYRKAVELNPLLSYSENINKNKVDKSSFSRNSLSCSTSQNNISDTRSTSSAGNLSDKKKCLTRSRGITRLIDNHLNADSTLLERSQPDGAEIGKIQKRIVGAQKSNLENIHDSDYRKLKKSRVNKKVSRSSRSIPLASSTMIREPSPVNKSIKDTTFTNMVLKRQSCDGESIREKITSFRDSKSTKQHRESNKSSSDSNVRDTLYKSPKHCSLQFLEPLSVIEPTNRDTQLPSFDSTYGSLSHDTTRRPLTSTRIWEQHEGEVDVRSAGCDRKEALQKGDFKNTQLSHASRGYHSHERPATSRHTSKHVSSHNTVPEATTDDSLFIVTSLDSPFTSNCPLYNTCASSRDSGLSSVSPDSLTASSMFKKPKCVTRKRQLSDKENETRNSLPRTSTPMPGMTPTLDNFSRRCGFDKKRLSKKMKQFSNSFYNESATEITTLASF